MEHLRVMSIEEGKPEVRVFGVTEILDYVNAREQADAFVQDPNNFLGEEHQLENFDLHVTSMPELIYVLATDDKIRSAVRPKFADTTSIETQGLRKRAQVLQFAHGASTLSTLKGIQVGFQKIENYGFMPANLITDETLLVGHEDLRKGNVPEAGKPYVSNLTVPNGYTLISRDTDEAEVLAMHKAGKLVIYESGQLSFAQARMDDRFLAGVGSPENVERAIKIVESEGYNSIGSYHRIAEIGFPKKSRGRPVSFDDYYDGLLGNLDIGDVGRFLVVGDGVAQVSAEGTSQNLESRMNGFQEIIGSIKSGKPFEYNGKVYAPIEGIELKR